MRRLRACPETADIPVVIVSADATTTRIERMCQAGACDYLSKPFEVTKLLEIIDNAIELARPLCRAA